MKQKTLTQAIKEIEDLNAQNDPYNSSTLTTLDKLYKACNHRITLPIYYKKEQYLQDAYMIIDLLDDKNMAYKAYESLKDTHYNNLKKNNVLLKLEKDIAMKLIAECNESNGIYTELVRVFVNTLSRFNFKAIY